MARDTTWRTAKAATHVGRYKQYVEGLCNFLNQMLLEKYLLQLLYSLQIFDVEIIFTDTQFFRKYGVFDKKIDYVIDIKVSICDMMSQSC